MVLPLGVSLNMLLFTLSKDSVLLQIKLSRLKKFAKKEKKGVANT
jgi:hypothetical protein